MISILFIGYGSITSRHIENLEKLKNNYNYFILSRKKKINIKNLNYNKVTHFKKIKDIKNLKFKYGFICSGSNEHIKHFKLINKICRKIFIEKPISNSILEIRKNKKYLKQNKIQVGYNFIFLDIITFIKKFFLNKKEKIQKIHVKAGYFLPYWRKNINYQNSVSAKKKFGGGVVLELSHEISYIIWLFGKPKFVYAKLFKISDLKIDVEDSAFIILEYNKFVCSIELDLLSKSYDRFCKIDSNKNSYIWEYKKNSFIKNNKNSSNKLFHKKFNINQSYFDEIKYFMNSKNKYGKLLFKNSIDTLSIIESVKKSSKMKGMKIRIKYEK